MLPAHQGLEARDLAELHVEDRLIKQHQLVARTQGGAQFFLQLQLKERACFQIQDIADSLVDEASIVKLLKDIHNLSFTSPLYGVYRNPDFGRQLPDTLPLLAFDKQPLNKPLEIALPA